MAHWQENDIAALIAGTGGVAVVHGGEGGLGLLDLVDEHDLPGATAAHINEHRILTVQTSLFPTLKVGETLTVDGATQKVVDRQKIGDGALTRLLIRRPVT